MDMDSERIYWIALGIYGLTMLLHGGIQVISEGATILNWAIVFGALLVLVGGVRGLRSSNSLGRVSRPIRYLGIFGASLATVSVVLGYLF